MPNWHRQNRTYISWALRNRNVITRNYFHEKWKAGHWTSIFFPLPHVQCSKYVLYKWRGNDWVVTVSHHKMRDTNSFFSILCKHATLTQRNRNWFLVYVFCLPTLSLVISLDCTKKISERVHGVWIAILKSLNSQHSNEFPKSYKCDDAFVCMFSVYIKYEQQHTFVYTNSFRMFIFLVILLLFTFYVFRLVQPCE